MENEKPVDLSAVLALMERKIVILQQGVAAIKVMMGEPDAGQTLTHGKLTYVGELPDPNAGPEQAAPGIDDPHAFFGMSVANAVGKYLTATKKPTTAADLATALQSGGFPSQSDNFASTITTALYRQKDVFVRVKRGLWGLKAWYPNYRAPDKKD